MQNVQNAAEIQQRVINLVELYRSEVTNHSDIANEYREEEGPVEGWQTYYPVDDELLDYVENSVFPEEKLNQIRVDEQLLGYYYSVVAGDNAEKSVLDQLLPNFFDDSIFSEEDNSFLIDHFKEMVNYIIQRPFEDKNLPLSYDAKSFSLPKEVLDFIGSRFVVPEGSVIFNPFPGLGQFSQLYKNCMFYYTDKNAWMEVALYANDINADIIKAETLPSTFDAVMSLLPWVPEAQDDDLNDKSIRLLCDAYNNLGEGGKFLLVCPNSLLWARPYDYYVEVPEDGEECFSKVQQEFRERLVMDGSIAEIIQLPDVFDRERYCVLIAEKGLKANCTTMIDAAFALKASPSNDLVLDNDAITAMLCNSGINANSGYRKMVEVRHNDLKSDMLLPKTYVIERPTESDCPIPLSDLCTLFPKAPITLYRDKLSKDTPFIKMGDLSRIHKGELDLSSLEAYHYHDKSSNSDNSSNQRDDLEFGLHLIDVNTNYYDGKKDAVFFKISEDGIGIKTAFVRATGKPIAVSRGMNVLCANQGVNIKQLLAIIRQPIVYRQIEVYEHIGLYSRLNEILVPWNPRIRIEAGKELLNQEKVHEEYLNKVASMKADYINEVRMRKHDMGQKVFDLINTEDLMRYYVENREIEHDLWPQLEEQLDHLRNTIHELSEMLDHLSQEEHFGSPELINLDDYLKSLQHSNNINGFTLSYQMDKGSVINAFLTHLNNKGITNEQNAKVSPTVWIAKNDLQRVISNILSNAQKHGFINDSRQDYMVKIVLSFNSEKDMYQIDFRNNGQPFPEGLDKLRYGIKGEKAGQTAGTGLGGSVVKSIVDHYKGDYDVFMDGEWTVVRIYLPIAI